MDTGEERQILHLLGIDCAIVQVSHAHDYILICSVSEFRDRDLTGIPRIGFIHSFKENLNDC